MSSHAPFYKATLVQVLCPVHPKTSRIRFRQPVMETRNSLGNGRTWPDLNDTPLPWPRKGPCLHLKIELNRNSVRANGRLVDSSGQKTSLYGRRTK